MTQESFALRDSGTYYLPLTGPIYVEQHDGLGMPTWVRALQIGPYQDGATLIYSRMEPRAVTLGLVYKGVEEDIWTYREGLMKMLTGFKTLWLDITLPGGAVRRLAVKYNEGLTLPRKADDLDGFERDTVQFLAYDPLFFDPVPITWSFSGTGALNIQETKAYTGTWASYPIITVTGPVTDLVIENETNDTILDFTGYALEGGHTMTINLAYGYKTIRLEDDTNLITELVAGSDLFNWRISPEPEAAGGGNALHITGTGATAATGIDIEFYTRYIGI